MLQGSGAMPTLVVEEGIVNFSNGKSTGGGFGAAGPPRWISNSDSPRWELPDSSHRLSRFNALPGALLPSPALWDQA